LPTIRLRKFLEHENEPVGQQHLFQVIALIEMGDERPLEHDAEHHESTIPTTIRDEQVARERGQRERHVRADHVEAAMGEVDDAHDPEDQRQPLATRNSRSPYWTPFSS
jgi:hypothetical protein